MLTYHRVERADAEPAPHSGVTVAPDVFAAQMEFLKTRRRVVAIDEAIHAVTARQPLPQRSVLITFDDAYRDFQTHAWPVLQSLGLPVSLFVPTAFPGDPGGVFWWDRLHHALRATSRRDVLETSIGPLSLDSDPARAEAFDRLRGRAKRLPHAEAVGFVATICDALGVPPPPSAVLGWDALRALARAGVTIGSHTRTHPLLTRITPDAVRAELAGSRRDLERELGTAPPILAYPAGAFDDEVVRVAGEEGFVLGFTTVRGVNDLRTAHPLRLRRINVGGRTTLPLLRGQLTGWAQAINRFHSTRTA